MQNKLLTIAAIVVGVVLIVIAVIYFLKPANALPGFFPGFDPALTRHHYTHGVGTLVLGLGALVFAWFQSGKKSAKEK